MKKTKGIIDRFEGEFAVVEMNGEMQDLQKSLLPPEAEVGDVIIMGESGITLDKKETEKLRKEIEDLMEEVWED